MQPAYRHEALPYDGAGEFVATCVGLAEEAFGEDQRLILLAGSAKLDAVSDALGADAADVTFVPTDEHGRNPSRITTLMHGFQATGDGRHSLGVNESMLSARTSAARLEAQMSEFLLNDVALRSWSLSIVCLYDTEALDAPTVDSMWQSHAVVRGTATNDRYLPDHASSLYRGELDPPPPATRRMSTRLERLAEMRAFVRGIAVEYGIAADRVEDLVLAANEIVTNSLRYGGGSADVGIWFADGAAVCEVRDRGHVKDRLAGRFTPPPAATSGRGLWLANHLCDLVQIRSSPARTVVRLHVDR